MSSSQQIIPNDETHQATELNADIPTQFGIEKYEFNGQFSLKKVCRWLLKVMHLCGCDEMGWREEVIESGEGD